MLLTIFTFFYIFCEPGSLYILTTGLHKKAEPVSIKMLQFYNLGNVQHYYWLIVVWVNVIAKLPKYN